METGRAELVAAESPADVVVGEHLRVHREREKREHRRDSGAARPPRPGRDQESDRRGVSGPALRSRAGRGGFPRSMHTWEFRARRRSPKRFSAGGGTALPMASNLVAPLTEKYPLIPPSRIRATAPWTAYLKVSEGCDHACTFCSIPSFRGRHRSKPLENIFEEARRLVDAGACELNLIAQDTTAYGMDLYKELALPRLLEGLGKIDGLKWVRLLYCYPTMMTDRLVKTMADTPNVAHYVDIPLQHGSDSMLKRMKRGGSVSSYHRILERLRGAMPDIAIRTTFLVGFPGETDDEFFRASNVRRGGEVRSGWRVYVLARRRDARLRHDARRAEEAGSRASRPTDGGAATALSRPESGTRRARSRCIDGGERQGPNLARRARDRRCRAGARHGRARPLEAGCAPVSSRPYPTM